MKKIQLEILGLSPSQSQGSTSFAIILGEVDGKRRLPIVIGMFEAQAIAIEMDKIHPSRPMTHDLFKIFSEEFDFSLEEIFISDLSEGVFIAKIIGRKDEKLVKIDARPSDAIAIALRFCIDIYTYENILEEAGIVLEESKEQPAPKREKEDIPFEEQLKRMSITELNQLLKEALEQEAYEQATHIHNEINRRN